MNKYIYDNKLIKDIKEINNKKINISKPILKWVGGKTQILDKLIIEFPININNLLKINSLIIDFTSFVTIVLPNSSWPFSDKVQLSSSQDETNILSSFPKLIK